MSGQWRYEHRPGRDSWIFGLKTPEQNRNGNPYSCIAMRGDDATDADVAMIVAAPETAAERDALRSERDSLSADNQRLREALEAAYNSLVTRQRNEADYELLQKINAALDGKLPVISDGVL